MTADAATPKQRSHSVLRWVKAVSLTGMVVLVAISIVYGAPLWRAYNVIRLFEPDRIVDNFRSMEPMFEYVPVRRGPTVHHFDRDPREVPGTYEYNGRLKRVADFLDSTWTTGMVVIVDDTIVFEQYYRGNTAATRTISWSVAKSFVSALVGIAIDDGDIEGVQRPISDYLPTLEGSGYDGVPIKDVLQMSSGIRFNEDYGDFWSDINRLGRAIAFNTSLDTFVSSLRRERTPGTYHHYVSMDTQVLGMLLRQVTGATLASYLETRIWRPLGMESDASWLVDSQGVELAFGGLNAVLRDYARLGVLYLNDGRWAGKQIVPAAWIRASVTPDAAHLQPGENPASNSLLGYGYQWWIPQQPDGDYLAIGVHNQFIYVYPRYGVVIAKSSAYPNYNVDGGEKELETIEVFRAIARYVGVRP